MCVKEKNAYQEDQAGHEACDKAFCSLSSVYADQRLTPGKEGKNLQ